MFILCLFSTVQLFKEIRVHLDKGRFIDRLSAARYQLVLLYLRETGQLKDMGF